MEKKSIIHKTAIVSKKARLGAGVSVGPYTIIDDGVSIGDATRIGAHCVVTGNTTLGKHCELFTGAVVGSRPQDLKYKGEQSFLIIGDNNIIREYTTFNPATKEGGKTIVGKNNIFMAYAHVAHDCVVGNHCIIANSGTLAGHVTIEDNVVIGGLTAIHQFVRAGRLSIIGGCSKVVQDIPPFSTCDGHPAEVYGLNLVGLRRNAVSKESIEHLRRVYKLLFNSGHTVSHALELIDAESARNKEVAYLIDFVKSTTRGISHSCRSNRVAPEKSEDKDPLLR